MDCDIKALFDNYKENKQQSQNYEGQLIEYLKDNQYFQGILNKYGIQVFRLYLPILQYQIYRDGNVLVNNQDILVVNKGKIVLHNHQNQCLKQWVDGMLIQLQQNPKLICKSLGNTSIIKIGRSSAKQRKICQSIKKMQKQQLVKINNMNNQLSKDQKLVYIRGIIDNIPYFSNLGDFDKKELAGKCSIQSIKKQQYTHHKGQQCKRVGYILSGAVKLIYFGQIESKHNLDYIITKYMVRKCLSEKQGIVFSELKAGNWIGLQQNILEDHFSSSGKVSSQQCKILWMPAKLFLQKFNDRTAHTETARLKNTLAAKKVLLNRSLLSKQEKQLEMNKQVERLKINQENTNRLKQLNLAEMYKMGHTTFRQSHKKSISGLQFPSKMADKLIRLEKKKSIKLPGLNSTLNLFPEQYEKATLPNDIGSDYNIHQVKQIFYSRKKRKSQKDLLNNNIIKRHLQRSPDVIRKLIIQASRFRTIQKQKVQQSQTQRKLITSSQSKILQDIQKNKMRFNNSIYNNFKITSRKNFSGILKNP